MRVILFFPRYQNITTAMEVFFLLLTEQKRIARSGDFKRFANINAWIAESRPYCTVISAVLSGMANISFSWRIDTLFAIKIMHDVDVAFVTLLPRSSFSCGDKAKVALHSSACSLFCHVNFWQNSPGCKRGRMKITVAHSSHAARQKDSRWGWPWGYSFCRESVSFAVRLLILPRVFLFCREVISLAASLAFAMRLFRLLVQLWATVENCFAQEKLILIVNPWQHACRIDWW